MINLLFIIIILTSASIFSQEENYSVKNDFVVWSKIYEGTPSIDNLALEYLDGSTSGKIKAGSLAYNWLLMEGLFRIEEKEGKSEKNFSRIKIR